MNTDEAMRVLWMTISGYAEDCLSDDSEELEELQQAWTIVSEKMHAAINASKRVEFIKGQTYNVNGTISLREELDIVGRASE